MISCPSCATHYRFPVGPGAQARDAECSRCGARFPLVQDRPRYRLIRAESRSIPHPPPVAPAASAPPPAAADVAGTPLKAPMPGMIIRYEKQVGDAVSKGDTVVILEAMKMENALLAPADGTIQAINFSTGDNVAKDAVLCVIG